MRACSLFEGRCATQTQHPYCYDASNKIILDDRSVFQIYSAWDAARDELRNICASTGLALSPCGQTSFQHSSVRP